MSYEYKNLSEDGYRKFSISRKNQNRIFKYRKWGLFVNYEYYVKDKTVIMQKIPNVYGCIASTVLLPLGLILEGLSNAKGTCMDMVVKVWFAKKYGAFSSDAIYKRDGDDGTFDKLISVARYK